MVLWTVVQIYIVRSVIVLGAGSVTGLLIEALAS